MIDLHIHGTASVDTTSASPEALLEMASFLLKDGIKAFLPVVYSESIDTMRRHMDFIKKAMVLQAEVSGAFSKILGIYLEGPFLNPQYAGALRKETFILPSLEALSRLIDGYEDIIKIITIAPEFPGALDAIERCIERGIKVHMGHSGATYKEALDGKKAGATGITHLFNASRPIHHREPGITGLGLLDRDLYVELICDGMHICQEILGLVFSIKPVSKIIAISDGVKACSHTPGAEVTVEGVLRGSPYTLLRTKEVLKGIGLSEESINMVTYINPLRYISGEETRGGTYDP